MMNLRKVISLFSISSIIFLMIFLQYNYGSMDLYTIVSINFDFNQLMYRGNVLYGSVTIGLIGPGNISLYRFDLDQVSGRIIQVDLNSGIEAWKKYFLNILTDGSRKSLNSDIPIPSISIFMFLHDKYGNEYVGSYLYSTYDFLQERFRDYNIVTEKIVADPLIMFRSPLSITVTLDRLVIRKVDFKSLLDNVVNNTFTYPIKSLSNKYYSSYMSICPTYFTSVYWGSLYSSRNSLPDGWRERISGYNVDDQMKLDVWSYFASKYSLAYYYKSNIYTTDDALNAVENELGDEGIYTMWSFLFNLFYKLFGGYGVNGLSWETVYTSGTTFSVDIPIISIDVDYIENIPIEFRIEAEKWVYNQYRHGLTILGSIALGSSKTVTYYFNKVAYVRLNTLPVKYIFIPTTYWYSNDGVVLTFDVSEVTYNGCKYWRVVPVTTFIPLYVKVGQDWRSAYVVGRDINEPDPPSFRELVWKYNVENIYSTYVDMDTPFDQPFFQDQTVNSYIPDYIAGQQVNILMNVLSYVLASILSQNHPALSIFMSLAGSFTGYAETNAGSTAIILKVEGIKYGFIDGSVYVSVSKYTTYELSDNMGNYLPLMVKYRAQIGYQINPGPLHNS